MAASLTATNVFGTLSAGNQNLSLFDQNFTQLYGGLNSLNNYGNYYADSGSANAYAITVPTTQTYSLAAGLPFQIKALNSNTASTGATLAITTGGTTATVSIVNPDGTALGKNQIVAGGIYSLMYDGTNAQLLGATRITRETVITSSTTYTPTAGMRGAWVRIVGGGGGSGGCTATGAGTTASAGGGGGAGYAESVYTAAQVGTSISVTIGTGGAAGAVGAAGGTGGTTSFGTLMSAGGGAGGAAGSAVAPGGPIAGGLGGAASIGSSGTINLAGEAGRAGMNWGTGSNNAFSGDGGGSVLGARSPGISVSSGATTPGQVGQNYGGAASGAANGSSQSATVGSAGAPGACIIVELF